MGPRFHTISSLFILRHSLSLCTYCHPPLQWSGHLQGRGHYFVRGEQSGPPVASHQRSARKRGSVLYIQVPFQGFSSSESPVRWPAPAVSLNPKSAMSGERAKAQSPRVVKTLLAILSALTAPQSGVPSLGGAVLGRRLAAVDSTDSRGACPVGEMDNLSRSSAERVLECKLDHDRTIPRLLGPIRKKNDNTKQACTNLVQPPFFMTGLE